MPHLSSTPLKPFYYESFQTFYKSGEFYNKPNLFIKQNKPHTTPQIT